nr:MAG TPA: hypothetical protein [Caudoviricetes sp.]
MDHIQRHRRLFSVCGRGEIFRIGGVHPAAGIVVR